MGRLTAGRVHVVPRGAAVDVRADEEADARQRQPAAGGWPRRSASSSCSTSTPRCTSAPGATPLPPFRDAIEFRDVVVRLRGWARAQHAARRVVHRARRADDRHRRPQRRRQDHAGQPAAAVLRRDRAARSPIDGRDIRDVTLRVAARADRHRHAGDGALRRYDRRQHRLRHAGAQHARRSKRRRARRTRTISSPRSRTATRRRSASAASGCRAASGSGWRSRARC